MRLALAGASGRMGRMVQEVLAEQGLPPALSLGRDSASSEAIRAALDQVEAVVDFSTPALSLRLAEVAALARRPALVIGTTGFSTEERDRLEALAAAVPSVIAANMAPGVTLLAEMLRQAAAALPAEAWDIEIVEMHHRAKRDAPSGTALMLGCAAAEGRGGAAFTLAREGLSPGREQGGIGLASLRGGEIIGDHAVHLAGPGELLTFSHRALDRRIFARGAVLAARWVSAPDRAPGLYDMRAVLGLGP